MRRFAAAYMPPVCSPRPLSGPMGLPAARVTPRACRRVLRWRCVRLVCRVVLVAAWCGGLVRPVRLVLALPGGGRIPWWRWGKIDGVVVDGSAALPLALSVFFFFSSSLLSFP